MKDRVLSRWILHGAALVLIISTAAALRLYGTSLYHPDERMIVDQAKHMALAGDYMPRGIFNYPSFYPTLQAVITKYLPTLGKGVYNEEAERTVPHYYLRARFITALLGTLTVLVVYLIGCSLGWSTAGLAGAAFVAVSLNHVDNSHYASVDVPMTLNVTLAFLFTCMHYRSGSFSWAALGGIFCGLAVGTKYNAALIIVPYILSLVLVAQRKGSLGSWLAVVWGLLFVPCGFLIACPYFLSIPDKYIYGLRQQIRIYSSGFMAHDTSVGPNNWVWNTTYLWRVGMGALPICLSFCGFLALLFRQRAKGWLLVSFPLCYFTHISMQAVHFSRNLTVLTPFLSLMAGYALWRLSVYLLHWKHKVMGAFIIALLSGIIFWQPFSLSLNYARMMARPDPRTSAIEWAKSNIPEGSKIAVDFLYGPRFSKSTYRITENLDLAKNPISWYLDQSYDYIVTSSGYFMHWCPEAKLEWAGFYHNLKEEFEVVATFPGNELGFKHNYYVVPTRPTITVYDLHRPRCAAVAIVGPADGSSVERSSCELRWNFHDKISGGRQKAYHAEVDRRRGDVIVLEAEDLLKRAVSKKRWARRTQILGYIGDGSLGASRSSPALESSFSLERSGHYYCWVRYHWRSDGITNITVGNLSTDLDIEGRQVWLWERLGETNLPKGENRIVIDHTGEKFTVIDSFVFTTDSAFSPNKDQLWIRVVDTGEVSSAQTSLSPSIFSDLEPGLYRARVRAENEKGRWGPWSSFVSFRLVKGRHWLF